MNRLVSWVRAGAIACKLPAFAIMCAVTAILIMMGVAMVSYATLECFGVLACIVFFAFICVAALGLLGWFIEP